MSPFDELMAQHHQQLQRERQLLKAAAASGASRGFDMADAPVKDVSNKIIPPPPLPPTGSGPGASSHQPRLEDIPLIAEPPFEYSTPPIMSNLSKKSISENTADVKRGLLSSILEKVKSKEEAAAVASVMGSAGSGIGLGTPPGSGSASKRYLVAPLASSESLATGSDVTSMTTTLSKRLSAAGTASTIDSAGEYADILHLGSLCCGSVSISETTEITEATASIFDSSSRNVSSVSQSPSFASASMHTNQPTKQIPRFLTLSRCSSLITLN